MPTESPKAAAAYAIYEQMGTERSLAKLAEHLGQSVGKVRVRIATLEQWSSAYHWQARVQAYDAAQRDREREQREKADEAAAQRKAAREAKREADRERMDDERSEVFRAAWRKALAAISKKIDDSDVKGLVGLTAILNRALDEERLSLGGATTKQQVDVTSNGATVGQQRSLTLEELLTIQQTLRGEMLTWRRERDYDGTGDL